MVLSASPFDAKTGTLLPVYRDAYLRGDLSRENTALVDAYLKKHAALGDQTWQRFHAMQQAGEQVRPVGWVQRQFDQIQAQPQRFRRRAASLVTGLALITGAVFASTGGNESHPELTAEPATAEATTALHLITVHGRILDEKGHPLVGATVLEKGSRRGVSTNSQGEYSLAVSTRGAATLAYGYGGYADEEVLVQSSRNEDVTLAPRSDKPAHKAKRWLLF